MIYVMCGCAFQSHSFGHIRGVWIFKGSRQAMNDLNNV